MYRLQYKAAIIMNKQGNMTPSPKETDKTSVMDPKEMKIYELSDKELRRSLLKKSSEL